MSTEENNFNKDELETPEWLNAQFLTTVLKSCTKDDGKIIVDNFQITPATAKGDHYASVMFRATVKYSQNGVAGLTKSLIIKSMPVVEGTKKELLGDSHLFETEIGMYTEVIPKFEQILRSIGDDTVLGAPCLYHSMHPRELIIFEDIVPLGYTVIRDRSTSLEEVKASYTKLAKWHAISHNINFEQPSFFNNYCHSMMSLSQMLKTNVMMNGIKRFLKLLGSVPTLSEYAPYFATMEDNLLDRIQVSFDDFYKTPRTTAYYVLCHGDFHAKNMMFKHNMQTGKFEDVMLLDFQLSYMGSMVMDLMYSFYMLLDTDKRVHHLDELLEHYLHEFCATAKKIGYKGRLPQLIELKEELKYHRHWNLFLLSTFLPLWYAFQDKTKDIDPDDFMKSEEVCEDCTFNNKRYIDELHLLLPKYKALGYFDNL